MEDDVEKMQMQINKLSNEIKTLETKKNEYIKLNTDITYISNKMSMAKKFFDKANITFKAGYNSKTSNKQANIIKKNITEINNINSKLSNILEHSNKEKSRLEKEIKQKSKTKVDLQLQLQLL